MAINRDFRDLFAALNDAGARFLVVGGYAVAFHSQPRHTEDLLRADTIYPMGIPPNRIDLVTGLDAVTFEEGWRSRCTMTYGDQEVAAIGREALIANKRAIGRAQDLADVERLEGAD